MNNGRLMAYRAESIREVVEYANEREITKEQIVTIVYAEGNFILTYYKYE